MTFSSSGGFRPLHGRSGHRALLILAVLVAFISILQGTSTADEKQLEDAYQTLRETVKPKPYPNLEAFKTIFKDVSDKIPAAKTANAKEFVDTSYLEELDKSGYIDGLYR